MVIYGIYFDSWSQTQLLFLRNGSLPVSVTQINNTRESIQLYLFWKYHVRWQKLWERIKYVSSSKTMCHQWRQSWHQDNARFSVYNPQIHDLSDMWIWRPHKLGQWYIIATILFLLCNSHMSYQQMQTCSINPSNIHPVNNRVRRCSGNKSNAASNFTRVDRQGGNCDILHCLIQIQIQIQNNLLSLITHC